MSRSSPHVHALRDALRPRLHNLILELWEKEGAARDFTDPEGVHQMRVASRKLRAALDAGDDLFTRKPERRLRTRVRRLAQGLGAVRDGDVMIATLHELPEDGQDRPGVQRLIDRLDRQRDADRKTLLGLLDEVEASGFREASLAIFDDTDDAPHKIRRRDARALVQEPRDRFLVMSGKLPEENDVEGLHQLRIVAKRLRYTLQLVEQALAPVSTQILGPLGAMQDHLGDIHNADVLIGLIRDELPTLVDDSIDKAMDGDTTRDPGALAAWDDLLSLLAQAAQDRHARYEEFAGWWRNLQQSNFPQQLRTTAEPRRGKS